MALHNDGPISDRYWAISRQKYETFFDWLPVTNIIRVLVLHNILLKCSLTLTILVMIWISIILLFQFICDFIYSAIIHMCDVSDDLDGIFACWVQRRSQRPPSTKQPEFALSQQWLIRVESCGRAKPLRGECKYVLQSLADSMNHSMYTDHWQWTTKWLVSETGRADRYARHLMELGRAKWREISYFG
jgi:hypothetical protein